MSTEWGSAPGDMHFLLFVHLAPFPNFWGLSTKKISKYILMSMALAKSFFFCQLSLLPRKNSIKKQNKTATQPPSIVTRSHKRIFESRK